MTLYHLVQRHSPSRFFLKNTLEKCGIFRLFGYKNEPRKVGTGFYFASPLKFKFRNHGKFN